MSASVETGRRPLERNWETTEADVDLRLGGTVRVVMRDPEKDVEYGGGGYYTEIEPQTSGLWDEEAVRTHEHGWGKLFDGLERTLDAERSNLG